MANIMTTDKILEVLSRFKEDIKNSKFVQLYDWLDMAVDDHTGEVTRFLLDLGINPLKLDSSFVAIPRYYLEDDQWVFNFGKVPDNITTINRRAFSNSNLTYIDLNNVKVIRGKAFASCQDLKKIFIPKTVVDMKGFIFADSGLEEIEFELGSDCSLMGTSFTGADNLKKITGPREVIFQMTDRQLEGKEIIYND
jgi:hypothetical protein